MRNLSYKYYIECLWQKRPTTLCLAHKVEKKIINRSFQSVLIISLLLMLCSVDFQEYKIFIVNYFTYQ